MTQAANRQGLDNKVAIITGATGGIGEATARLFLELGAKVMLVGRSAEKLAQTHSRLKDIGECATAVADSVDEAANKAAVDATVARFGGLDIMVANAGTEGAAKPIEALSVAEFEDVLKINVIGVWLAMKYAAAPMRERGGGRLSPYHRSPVSSAFPPCHPTSPANTRFMAL